MFYIQDSGFPREHGIKPLHSQFWEHFKSFLFSCAFLLYLTARRREASGWCKISAPKCSLILQHHWNHLLFQKKTVLHKCRQFKTLHQTNDRICKPREVQLNSVIRMHLTLSVTYLAETMSPRIFFIVCLHTYLLHSEVVVSMGLNMVMTNKKLKNILEGQTASQRLSNRSNRD